MKSVHVEAAVSSSLKPYRCQLVIHVAALHLLLYCPTNAQNLTAVKCNGVLPTGGRTEFAILYDKLDSIYLFGGRNDTDNFDEVIKYSISADTTEIVGQLPQKDYDGGAVSNKLGHIFYLSGKKGFGIYEFDPHIGFRGLSCFTYGRFSFATISPDNDTALLIGGYPKKDTITSLNLNNLESKDVLSFHKDFEWPSATWAEERGVAYIFEVEFRITTLHKYFRSSNRAETSWLHLPIKSVGAYGAIWYGGLCYLVGEITDGNPTQSLLQFDPETEKMGIIPVDDYVPVGLAAAIYVEKLNRIYTFGGKTWDGIYQDGIYYIDMDPLSSPNSTTTNMTRAITQPSTSTTTAEVPLTRISAAAANLNRLFCPDDDPMPPPGDCLVQGQGHIPTYFPYPEDCRKFFQCSNGDAICRECSNGTVWNQELSLCDPTQTPATTEKPSVLSPKTVISSIIVTAIIVIVLIYLLVKGIGCQGRAFPQLPLQVEFSTPTE